MLSRTTALAALIIALLPSLGSAEAKIPWNKLIGVDTNSLSSTEKARVASNLERIANPYGCKGTLLQCIVKGDLTARRHAGFVARMVKKNKDDAFIDNHIALRHQSTHTSEIAAIDLSAHPPKGDPSAKVVLVEFACFQCPFCAHLAPKLDTLNKKFGDKIVQYYKYFPVRSHPEGVAAAAAAHAAQKQGRFWQMYKLLFENRADLKETDLEKYAKAAGLDVERWKRDKNAAETMQVIEKDKLEGMRLGVDGTPTFFINGKTYQGVHNITELEDRIAEELDILEGRIP